MRKSFEKAELHWINQPKTFAKADNRIVITTEPGTDFWQRTYYGFQNDNAHALLMALSEDFTFTVKTGFALKKTYDQCGVIIYQDSENWFKSSIEFENETFSRLGSVVTNNGFSDWATTEIGSKIYSMYYRLSRLGNDFLLENSTDGVHFQQMRIFHLAKIPDGSVRFGIYACSPLKSSFNAEFSAFYLEDTIWLPYAPPA